MPTPSMALFLGRVVRSADSQVLVVPRGSVYVFLGGGGGVRKSAVVCEVDSTYRTSLVHTASFSG
jgi:hypothetical protein